MLQTSPPPTSNLFSIWARTLLTGRAVHQVSPGGIRKFSWRGFRSLEQFMGWEEIQVIRLITAKEGSKVIFLLELVGENARQNLHINLADSGAKEVVERILTWPDVDFQTWRSGMESKGHAVFHIWQRPVSP